jgi:hypothetical protein
LKLRDNKRKQRKAKPNILNVKGVSVGKREGKVKWGRKKGE